MIYQISKKKFKFSKIEIQDLLKAWAAISIAFAVLFSGGLEGLSGRSFAFYFLVSSITVGIAFLFHEIGHKIVAQRFGCWAEFRANNFMLILAIFMSFFGFIFIAPGAVIIQGHVTKSRNGKISLTGPLTNIALGSIFLIIVILTTGTIRQVAHYGVMINSWIAIFNLIPLGIFDGIKILRWNKIIYALLVISAIILMAVLPFFTA